MSDDFFKDLGVPATTGLAAQAITKAFVSYIPAFSPGSEEPLAKAIAADAVRDTAAAAGLVAAVGTYAVLHRKHISHPVADAHHQGTVDTAENRQR